MGPDSAAEIAGRLNPKASSFHKIPGGFQTLTTDDIAGALGFLKLERHRLWIHVAYAHHLDFYHDLKRLILTDIVNQFSHERWDNRPGMLSSMIDAAVLETISTTVCMTCNGQKSLLVDARAVTCDSCKGSGMERKSDYWRANMCHIHRELWKRHWRDRYNQILDIVMGLDYASKHAFAHRLTLL